MVTLEASRLFRQLKSADMAALRKAAQERTFSAGQEIFKEGDAGNGLYVVKDGMVEISAGVENNSRQVFSQVTPGEMFGEMAVIDDKPRSASALAKEKTIVYFVSRDDLLTLVEHSPALALALLREVS